MQDLMNIVNDLNLVLRTAHNSGLVFPPSTSAHSVYRASEGLSNMDHTSVASFLLKLNSSNTFWINRKIVSPVTYAHSLTY